MSAAGILVSERTPQAAGADDAEVQAAVLILSLTGLSLEARGAIGNTDRILLYTVFV
jgi:hypothetical protein